MVYPGPDARHPTFVIPCFIPSLSSSLRVPLTEELRHRPRVGSCAVYMSTRSESFHSQHAPPLRSDVDSFATTMLSSHSSKNHSNSFVSSPTWSLHTPTGTTASSNSGGRLPVIRSLAWRVCYPPGSARSVLTHSWYDHTYEYVSQILLTAGVPLSL
jgi:hypothetical protein